MDSDSHAQPLSQGGILARNYLFLLILPKWHREKSICQTNDGKTSFVCEILPAMTYSCCISMYFSELKLRKCGSDFQTLEKLKGLTFIPCRCSQFCRLTLLVQTIICPSLLKSRAAADGEESDHIVSLFPRALKWHHTLCRPYWKPISSALLGLQPEADWNSSFVTKHTKTVLTSFGETTWLNFAVWSADL